MKKEYKICFILWTIASILEFSSAVFGFISSNGGLAYSGLSLGCCFIIFAGLYFNKYKKEK